jgi:8-oxo-dGTP diphosphatase
VVEQLSIRRNAVLYERRGQLIDSGHVWIASGYLVHEQKVLLVLHRRFGLWVPPGGHVEPGESFAAAAEREVAEETGISVRAISSAPVIHPPDANATPIPVPFYVDEERERFAVPAIVHFFFVEACDTRSFALHPQLEEVQDARFFAAPELAGISTFDQVRSVAAYAIENHPTGGRSVSSVDA